MKSSSSRRKLLYACLLAAFTLTVAINQVQAQNPALMQMAQAELLKRGLTETEVRTRLLQKGIDVDNVPPAEYANYQSRVMATLDELQAEKKNATAISINVGGTGTTGTGITNQAGTIASQEPAPITTPEEAAADASQRIIQTASARKGSNIYGHSIFTDHSLDVFRTTDGAQAPETYVLGAGDEVHITIFGASQTDIQQRITNEGYIQPTGVARIFLKGLSLAQARRVIKESLSSSYLFRADQLAVTIVTARTVLVNVYGETKISGGFTLSALNSALNALSAAGGVSDFGSVRAIQLIRGETKKTIDVYEFMNDPSAQFKFDLQNNDILFVPVAKKIVNIEGAVKRPMRYEMIDGENLNDLIRYAGGLTMDVFPDFIQIQRFVNGEEKLFEWNLADIISNKTKVALTDGDIVRIKSINKPIDAFVEVVGSVYYPGKFDLNSNPSLTKLLANAKPNYQAKTDLLFVERMRPDSTVEFLTVPFPGSNNAPDFTLQGRDIVHIMNQVSYRDVDSISVVGQVRKPFARKFALNDRITVAQAIEYAGGLKESVYPVAYIFRRNLFVPTEMKYIRIELESAGSMQLQPGDQLNIYDNTTYRNVGELRISGAVKNPSTYTFDPTMSLRDLLTNAGGFNVGAAFNRVEVFRTVLSQTERTKLQLITLQVDSNYQLVQPKTFSLQPYDQIVVRMTPEFSLGRTVELNGQVKYPGVYVLENNKSTLHDIIVRAGGLLRNADPNGTSFFRTYNNRGQITVQLNKAMRHPNDLGQNPILFEGDVVNINRLENTVAILETGTRMAQYSIDTTANKIRNIVFQGRRSARWYIINYAGGFQKNADRNSVTVTYPNNQMQSTKRYLVFFNSYPTVVPGSYITMKMDPDKVEADLKPKEKVDWEATISKGLATLMSTLSVILLLRSL
ncbi:MAG TPA: SLBB domain-containing protein [Bacteroidales bacterium]|nr:SLBB domain-containing protein [Bacteroidales bacterium]